MARRYATSGGTRGLGTNVAEGLNVRELGSFGVIMNVLADENISSFPYQITKRR